MKKTVLVLLVLLSTVALFAGGIPEEGKQITAPPPAKLNVPLKIAYVPVVMNTHYDMVLSGLKEGIDKNGGDSFATLQSYIPSSNEKSFEEQITILETLLQQKDLDVLIYATENEEAMMPYLRKFCEQGVYVFLFNTTELKKENTYYVSTVTYDQYEASHLVGEWAIEYFKDNMTYIAVLEGTAGDLNTTRLNGFLDAIKGHDNLKIVASQSANWNRADGQTVTENLLISNPEINFIYGMYDEMALGALAATKAAQRTDIVIAGYDNTQDAYNSILAGELGATVNTAAKEQGTNLIHAIIEYCLLGNMVDKVINSELVVYDRSNITEFNTDNYKYVPRMQEKSWD